MTQIVIVGCGIVGAMTAYELSQVPGLQITVLDRHPPAQAATGAALGVLMGIISQKTKGRAWAMRQASMRYYAELLPRLEGVAWNSQGLVKLCFPEDDLAKWQELIQLRQRQGWQLELWTPAELRQRCPQVQHSDLTAAVYSPQDYQVDPTALTLALIEAAQQRGVEFRCNVEVTGLRQAGSNNQLLLENGEGGNDILTADWVVLAAGLGTTGLLTASQTDLKLSPVLGQAMRIQLPQPLGDPAFQPVITGRDIHVVPLKAARRQTRESTPRGQDYWVGATVEFASGLQAGQDLSPVAVAERLEEVWRDAIGLCPGLAQATRLQTWSGLRPRPQNQPAPVIEPLSGYDRVWLATGHYRNGVLLAPATAQLVRAAVQEQVDSGADSGTNSGTR
ncbi:MAG: NAD(P)/FAD-dependent oxidoreductase [Elainella sp.]